MEVVHAGSVARRHSGTASLSHFLIKEVRSSEHQRWELFGLCSEETPSNAAAPLTLEPWPPSRTIPSMLLQAPAPGSVSSAPNNAWGPSAVFRGSQQTPRKDSPHHQHQPPPSPQSVSRDSSTSSSSSSLYASSGSRGSVASISNGWSSPSLWTPTTSQRRPSHEGGAAQTAARSEARHQALQQLRRQHSATTSSVVQVASLLQQHNHPSSSTTTMGPLSRQSSFSLTPQRQRRPSSAHSSRHPDNISPTQSTSSGPLHPHSRPQTASPASRADFGTQTCGLSTSVSGGPGALSSPHSAAVLTDGSESRMFQQMSRSGLIKTPSRPSSARPASMGGSVRQMESAASAALAAMRASVAASARELLAALAAGTSSEQLVRLGMLEPGLAWGGHSGTSGSYLSTGRGTDSSQRASDLEPLDPPRFVGTPHVHIGQDVGGWTGMVSEPHHGTAITGCALTAVEREQLAEGRLQRCCTWVVNRTPEACCVCLDVMHLDESIVMTTCGHRFHRPCLKAHIVSGYGSSLQCPICRAALVQQPPPPQQPQQPQQA